MHFDFSYIPYKPNKICIRKILELYYPKTMYDRYRKYMISSAMFMCKIISNHAI